MHFRFAALAITVLLMVPLFTAISGTNDASAALRYLYGSGSQTGGRPVTFRVGLTEPALGGGASVDLLTPGPGLILDTTIVIPAGQEVRLTTRAQENADIDTPSPGSNQYLIPTTQVYGSITWATTGETIHWDFDCIPAVP